MMKKIITLIMCLICCCSYAFLYEGNGGKWLSEDIAVGSGGSFPVYEGDKCTITIANNINLTEIDVANIPIGYPTAGLFQYCIVNNLFANFDVSEDAYNIPTEFAAGTPLLVEATATYNVAYTPKPLTITYYSDENTVFTTQQYTVGSAISEPSTQPTYSNNDVFCWWKNLPKYMPASNISVYAEHQQPYIYTAVIDEANQTVEYADDAINKQPIRVSVDADGGAGTTTNWINNDSTSWRDWVESICCPVMLLNNGEEDYELSRDNHLYKSDGITASDITDDNYAGNAMVRFSKTFSSITRLDSSHVKVRISNYKADNTFTAYPWQTENGRNADKFYFAMFLQPDSTTFRSYIKSGATTLYYSSHYNTNSGNGRINFQNIGQGWDWASYSQYSYIRTLLILVTRSIRFQYDFAYGFITTNKQMGYSKDKGCFYGSPNDSYGNTGSKVFYIEGLYAQTFLPLLGSVYSTTENCVEGYKAYPPYYLRRDDNYSSYTFINVKPSVKSFGIVDNMLIPMNNEINRETGFDDDIVYTFNLNPYGISAPICLVSGGYSSTDNSIGKYMGAWYKGGGNGVGTARLAYLN